MAWTATVPEPRRVRFVPVSVAGPPTKVKDTGSPELAAAASPIGASPKVRLARLAKLMVCGKSTINAAGELVTAP